MASVSLRLLMKRAWEMRLRSRMKTTFASGGAPPSDLRPPQTELAEVGEGCHAHVAVEVVGESTLIAETEGL